MLKKMYFMAAMALGLAGLASCSSDDNKGDGEDPAPEVKPVEFSYDVAAEGEARSFDFTAPSSWTVSCAASWVTYSPDKGNPGKQTVRVTVNENFATSERTATVTVRTAVGNQTIATINVKQAGAANQGSDDPLNPDEEQHEMVGNMSSDAVTLVGNITVGWNLGNTCEGTGSHNDETDWGNPKTTQDMISFVRQCGFNTVRVPVRWYTHADADFNIDKAWLARVAEIVDYCVNEDMYVIINSHHDNWYDRLAPDASLGDIKKKFGKMWTQIARYFRDYDEHLIFAGVNEMISVDAKGNENWGEPTSANQNLLNELQEIFVNNVRATGGNNSVRCLMIQGWACNTDFVAKSTFKMPQDRVDGRLIYDFHMYTWTYSTEAAGNDSKYFWGSPYKSYTPWYANGESELDWRYGEVKKAFIDKGVPVIMSEFGSVQHNKSGNDAIADECRGYYHTQVVGRAKQRGIKCIYWDNGVFTSTNGENFGLIDRKNLTVPARAQVALDGIMAGLAY